MKLIPLFAALALCLPGFTHSQQDSDLALLAVVGDEIPSNIPGEVLTLTRIERFARSANGEHIAFTGFAIDEADVQINAVWLDSGSGFEMILREGDEGIGAEIWEQFLSVAVNDRGDLALYALVDEYVIATRIGGVITEVARLREVAPPLAENRIFQGFGNLNINDEGTVTFSGNASNGASFNGAWIYRDGNLSLLAGSDTDGTVQLDLANGDLIAFDQAAGLYTVEPVPGSGNLSDKSLRLPLPLDIPIENDTMQLTAFVTPLLNTSRQFSCLALVESNKTGDQFYAILSGEIPTEPGTLTNITLSNLVNLGDGDVDALTFPAGLSTDGSLLAYEFPEGTESYERVVTQDFAGANRRIIMEKGFQKISGRDFDFDEIDSGRYSLAADGSALVQGLFAGAEGSALILSTPRVLTPAAPVITLKGSAKKVTGAARLVLRGSVAAPAGLLKVENKAARAKPVAAKINAGGNAWKSRRITLRSGRNVIITRATDSLGQRSNTLRTVITRR